jgi:Asp-tRNA(Asn)/Glu-tRNA(Gln) amidotransferase C subunit/regulator of replication initiation timing
MSELLIIEAALSRAARRRRWAAALRGLWLGLLVGAVISLLLDGACHLLPLPLWTRVAVAVAPFPCLLAGLILGGWRRLGLAEAARWVDGREQLKERLSTALELATQPTAGSWRDLVVADAADHVRQLDPRRMAPLSLPATVTRWALVVLALGVGLGFVPDYRSKRFLQRRSDQQLIQQAGRRLAELTRRTLQARQPAMEPKTEKALESVTELAERLNKVSLTRSEALTDLANVSERLKDELRELAKDPALKRLEQAARAAGTSDSQSAAGLQKQIESLQKQLGAPTGNPEALEKLKKDLDKLQQAAKGLSDSNSQAAASQRDDLSRSLSALSRQAQDLGLQLPQLDAAIKALEANQTELFLKDLQASVTDLDKLKDMAKSLQQLQQQVEKLGKDLAEQLKNGQPEAAQMTLEKMAAQLRMAELPAEQLRQLAADVAKAIGPAGAYGKLAEHLKMAGKQLAAGDKPAASQSLAEAAKELERLAQGMGDAQSLAAELKALNEVTAAICSGRDWRPGQPGRPRMGKGGGTGGGVGTWADENGEWNGQWSDHWDNSGVERSDEDPRGHTDRGEGELSEALRPTKAPGKYSPGRPMPSVTLRNVSLKGQSKLEYQAAAAAAQSDAESALSHEQVPRAYQGAVKDYFDDLKQ